MIDNKKQIIQRIENLRSHLATHNVDAIIVPSADPHLSEYLPEYWQLRQWLSGFTGSMGTLVVTADAADIWADSRYWVQAEAQLVDTNIALQKLTKSNHYINWLLKNLEYEATILVDGDMLSVAESDRLNQALSHKNINLISELPAISEQSIAHVWRSLYQQEKLERPSLPFSKLFRHKAEFVSMSAAAKLAEIRASMQEHKVSHHLLSSLDDIGWLTNLRGADVDYNPVFLSHVLISTEQAIVFIDKKKVPTDISEELLQAGFSLAAYDEVSLALAKLTADDSLLIDPNKVAVKTLALMSSKVSVKKAVAPSTFLKSRKSLADIDNIREAMRQDGAALCEFFAEFERRIKLGERLSELDVDSMLIDYRSKQPHYVSPSFPTIAGFNGNGALPHYRATEESFSYFDGDGLLLIDSGAQYHNGTTDITRVVPIGKIKPEYKKDFTAVLKAHIALATACFPEGISSPQIDAICRAPLWKLQMDYGHGTGHGVGYFMNVHEGPQVIAYSAPVTPERAIKSGMITSNEPALYRENEWGIRIENLVSCMAVEDPVETVFGDYLYFETVTYCPIDIRLIDASLLNKEELEWLNNYHKKVYYELKDRVSDQAYAWLEKMTKAVRA